MVLKMPIFSKLLKKLRKLGSRVFGNMSGTLQFARSGKLREYKNK